MAVTASVRMNVSPSAHVAQVIRPQVQKNLVPRVQRVTAAAKQLAPKRTGRLANAIVFRARDDLGRFAVQDASNPSICTYEVAIPVPYAAFVVRGASPHIIRSRGPWPLRNRETGQVFGPVVRHPGQRPNDFLERALKAGGF